MEQTTKKRKSVFFTMGKWRIMFISGMWANVTEAGVLFYQKWKFPVSSWTEVSNSSCSDIYGQVVFSILSII